MAGETEAAKDLRELSRTADADSAFQLPDVDPSVEAVLVERADGMGFQGSMLLMEELLEPDVMKAVVLPIASRESVDEGATRKAIVIALEPLREAVLSAAVAVEELHDVEDQAWLDDLPERRCDFKVAVENQIQRDFLKRIGHRAHDGYTEDEIPVGITFRMSSVELAKVLDMARDRFGNVQKEMLFTVLDEGNRFTDSTTFAPTFFDDTANVRRGMRDYCGGVVNRVQIDENLEKAEQVLQNAVKGLYVGSEHSGATIDTLATLVRILQQDMSNRTILQNADNLIEDNQGAVLKVINRVIDAFVAGKANSDPKVERRDADFVMRYLRATRKVNQSLTNLGERMNEEIERYVKVTDQPRDLVIEQVVVDMTSIGHRDYYDIVWVQNEGFLMEKWSWVVSAFDHLANIRQAVTSKVLKLVEKGVES